MKIDISSGKFVEKKLCDHCLGRLFGKFGYGMSNDSRGKAIRYGLKMGIEMIGENELKKLSKKGKNKSIDCWLCGNLFDELEKFASLIINSIKKYEFDSFLVGSRIEDEVVEKEKKLCEKFKLKYHESIKSEINREVGKIVESRLKKNVEFKTPEIVAVIDTRYDDVELQISSLFIYGRYKKLVRGIPQTKWYCKRCRGKGCERCDFTGKIYPTSVEEIIAEKIMEGTNGRVHKLHGMGREDIDAKMLGDGRPFILEIVEPRKRKIDLKKYEKIINKFAGKKVEVRDLRFSSKKEVVRIKDAKLNKTYRATVHFEKRVKNEKLKELEKSLNHAMIIQRTPKRVAHRRADRVRKRKVIEMKIEKVKDKSMSIIITGERGLYIKELISGDDGRTKPSVSGFLGVKCIPSSLDVTDIHGV